MKQPPNCSLLSSNRVCFKSLCTSLSLWLYWPPCSPNDNFYPQRFWLFWHQDGYIHFLFTLSALIVRVIMYLVWNHIWALSEELETQLGKCMSRHPLSVMSLRIHFIKKIIKRFMLVLYRTHYTQSHSNAVLWKLMEKKWNTAIRRTIIIGKKKSYIPKLNSCSLHSICDPYINLLPSLQSQSEHCTIYYINYCSLCKYTQTEKS